MQGYAMFVAGWLQAGCRLVAARGRGARRACSPLHCTMARPVADCMSEDSMLGACWCVKCCGKPLKVQPWGTARLMASWNSVPPRALLRVRVGVRVRVGIRVPPRALLGVSSEQ